MSFPLRKVLMMSQRVYAPSVGTPCPIKMSIFVTKESIEPRASRRSMGT